MSQQDPLKKNRLGLRGILLVSGGVLLASSVFLLPDLGLIPGSATTALPDPPVTSGPGTAPGASSDPSPPVATRSQGAAAGPAETSRALLPVYWVGDVNGSDRLFREFLEAPSDATGDPIADAVRLMTAGEPLDPDYGSPWRAASNVSSSISTKNVITVDISSDAMTQRLDGDGARLALQQLVHTATAAAADAGLMTAGESSSVVVLVDGAANRRAFGSVDLGGEWTRDTASPAPVWIIDPQEGVVADPASLRIHGVGPASEDSVDWRIDREAAGSAGGTDLFRDGSVDIVPEGGVPGAYSFSVTLPPGRYEITVSAPSGDAEAKDTKTVVVR